MIATRKGRAALGAALVALVLLGACTSDDGSEVDDSSDVSPADTADTSPAVAMEGFDALICRFQIPP